MLFNGNMVFPTIKARFMTFLSYFNEKLLVRNIDIITPLNTCVIPFIKNEWISDITEGESCFTCSILSNTSGYRFRFKLTQKWGINKSIL